jgi:hypothetical protein
MALAVVTSGASFIATRRWPAGVALIGVGALLAAIAEGRIR